MDASGLGSDLEMNPDVSAAEQAIDSKSILQKIQDRRNEREDILTTDIPTWDGELRAKYQVVDRADIEKMIRKARISSAQRNGASATEGDTDFLIKACVGVIGYDSETDTEFGITDGYTMELAGMLDPKYPRGHPMEGQPVPITHPRELVAYLFKWNGVAIALHGQKIARWMQDTSKPVEDPQ